MSIPASILLIEDSPGECELFRLALTRAALEVALYTEHDAEGALHFLTDRVAQGLPPSVVLLDWHLRRTRGDTFLARLRSDTRLALLPVVVFTTSDDHADLIAGYRSSANGYVVKPGTFDQLVLFVHDLCGFWVQWNQAAAPVELRC